MNAIRIVKLLESHVLPELIPMVGKRVEIIVLEVEREGVQAGTVRKAGSAKGIVTISPDFDSPLDEFSEYMK